MKIKLSILITFAALFVFWSGSTVCYAQEEEEPIVGGYVKADMADAQVIAAAKFAVKRRSQTQKATINLLSIKNAEVQVVAGLNYELCMQVDFKKKKNQKAVKQFVQVVVYRNLKNTYSLTSWTEKTCAEQ